MMGLEPFVKLLSLIPKLVRLKRRQFLLKLALIDIRLSGDEAWPLEVFLLVYQAFQINKITNRLGR